MDSKVGKSFKVEKNTRKTKKDEFEAATPDIKMMARTAHMNKFRHAEPHNPPRIKLEHDEHDMLPISMGFTSHLSQISPSPQYAPYLHSHLHHESPSPYGYEPLEVPTTFHFGSSTPSITMLYPPDAKTTTTAAAAQAQHLVANGIDFSSLPKTARSSRRPRQQQQQQHQLQQEQHIHQQQQHRAATALTSNSLRDIDALDEDEDDLVADEDDDLTETRRQIHLACEQTRRKHIKAGLEELKNCIPGCESQKLTKTVILSKAVNYMHSAKRQKYLLWQEVQHLNKELERYRSMCSCGLDAPQPFQPQMQEDNFEEDHIAQPIAPPVVPVAAAPAASFEKPKKVKKSSSTKKSKKSLSSNKKDDSGSDSESVVGSPSSSLTPLISSQMHLAESSSSDDHLGSARRKQKRHQKLQQQQQQQPETSVTSIVASKLSELPETSSATSASSETVQPSWSDDMMNTWSGSLFSAGGIGQASHISSHSLLGDATLDFISKHSVGHDDVSSTLSSDSYVLDEGFHSKQSSVDESEVDAMLYENHMLMVTDF